MAKSVIWREYRHYKIQKRRRKNPRHNYSSDVFCNVCSRWEESADSLNSECTKG
jgi:hypothetical protein